MATQAWTMPPAVDHVPGVVVADSHAGGGEVLVDDDVVVRIVDVVVAVVIVGDLEVVELGLLPDTERGASRCTLLNCEEIGMVSPDFVVGSLPPRRKVHQDAPYLTVRTLALEAVSATG